MPLPRLEGQPVMAMGVGAAAEWMDENVELAWSVLSSSVGMLNRGPAPGEMPA